MSWTEWFSIVFFYHTLRPGLMLEHKIVCKITNPKHTEITLETIKRIDKVWARWVFFLSRTYELNKVEGWRCRTSQPRRRSSCSSPGDVPYQCVCWVKKYLFSTENKTAAKTKHCVHFLSNWVFFGWGWLVFHWCWSPKPMVCPSYSSYLNSNEADFLCLPCFCHFLPKRSK